MRVSYRWLCELLPGGDLEPPQFEDALSAVGLAVDGVNNYAEALRQVLLVEVIKVEGHPSRDGLRLVTIRTRKGDVLPTLGSIPPRAQEVRPPEQVTVVCGASNVPEPGWLVVFAGLGVKLPGVDFMLSSRKIGGVLSEGMLCSEAELGLADSSEGILTYPPGSFDPGTRFIDAFPEARDVIYELDITPNRPDALGHVGIARDMGAFFECALELPPSQGFTETGPATSAIVAVENQATDRCPKYGAAVVRSVKVAPSPDYIRWRLHRLGIRPISNVVDITNWLLLEYGQPLHAFDLRKVRGGKIVIRQAASGEKIKTLDDVERNLTADDLLICDAEGPTALAGIMGGAESEIDSTTQDVLLECAYFQPRGVRRSSRRHGLHTESSHRFERGTDHGMTEVVLNRARHLLADLAEGQVAKGTVRADGIAPEIPSIELSSARLDGLLGVHVPFKEATNILQRLGLRVEYLADTGRGAVASIRGASHRPDISIQEDLIEEVARIRGLDNIPTVLPAIPPQEERVSGRLEREAALTAVSLGLSEALLHAFVARSDLEALSAPSPVVSLVNPLSEDRSVLRTSLAPGLLEALRRSRRRGERRVQLFAIGAIFLPAVGDYPASVARVRLPADAGKLPYEQPTFAALLSGPRPEHLTLKPGDYDVYDAKAIAIEMVERMTRRRAQVEYVGATDQTRHLHPRGAAVIKVNGTTVGMFGPLHPDVIERFDLDVSALLVELNLATIEAIGKVVPRYQPIPKLPAITRDLSLVVSERTAAASVLDVLKNAAGELCESVELAAEFRGGSVPEGHRSLTFRVVYRDPKARTLPEEARTLTDQDVEAIEQVALARAKRDFGATLRG
jgi:phenylalanyl-tRNA synthetase beta chain